MLHFEQKSSPSIFQKCRFYTYAGYQNHFEEERNFCGLGDAIFAIFEFNAFKKKQTNMLIKIMRKTKSN